MACVAQLVALGAVPAQGKAGGVEEGGVKKAALVIGLALTALSMAATTWLPGIYWFDVLASALHGLFLGIWAEDCRFLWRAAYIEFVWLLTITFLVWGLFLRLTSA